MRWCNKLLSILLVFLLLCHPLSNVIYVVRADDFIQDVVIEDTIINDNVVYDTFINDKKVEATLIDDKVVTNSYIQEKMIYDEEEGSYKVIVDENINVESYAIEYVVGENPEEDLLNQLPEEYSWYDIDWGAVTSQLVVGSTVIFVVGVVNSMSASSAVGIPMNIVMGLSPVKVARKAFIGGVMAAAINLFIHSEHLKIEGGFRKYAIEGFAEGFMLTAIGSVAEPLIKKVVLPKRLTSLTGTVGKIKLNGDVVDDTGKKIGTAFYDNKTNQIFLSEGNNKKYRVFDIFGKERSNLSGIKSPSNTTLVPPGQGKKVLHYTDDVGNIFRKGNNLLPNQTIKINDSLIKTDKLGRIDSVFKENLTLKKDTSRLPIKDNLDDISKGFAKVTDERGHIVADMFGGSNSLENLTPMDGKINKGEYKKLEMLWKKTLDNGGTVENIKWEQVFSGNSFRADYFKITYEINGEKFVEKISNSVK